MKKNCRIIISFVLAIVLFLNSASIVLAEFEKPNVTPPSGRAPGESSSLSNSVSYSGASTITGNTTNEDSKYSSTTSSQNALLVSDGTSTLTNPTVTKSGDSDGDAADFYGTNAAVLVYNGATLNIVGGTITTSSSHANAVFSYGTGIINITDTVIKTSSNNSGGVMVTGGGVLNATNLTVETSGNSSASIRSDRGGGTLTVTGGTYKTTGIGSPSIYSTASITVNNATLESTSSEGIVVEGANSVTLNSVNLTDTNNTLNGNSETYKNIFLYQSMSGDADSGTATFIANDSTITTNKGDTFFVTNATATINLSNNIFTNNDGDFLRIQTGKWGNSGSNGGSVTLNLTEQTVSGDIIVDSISTLDMNLSSSSIYSGAINNINQAKNINVTLDSDSVIILTGDSYINSLNNSNTTNSNIYLNGYKLYVDDEEVEGNNSEYDYTLLIATNDTEEDSNDILVYVGIGVIIAVIGVVIFIINKKKKVK